MKMELAETICADVGSSYPDDAVQPSDFLLTWGVEPIMISWSIAKSRGLADCTRLETLGY